MRFDLRDVTFTIPVRIDSAERIRNLRTTLLYLNKWFDTHIVICEESALAEVPKALAGVAVDFEYFHLKSDSPLMHRTKALNLMAERASTPIIVNYDADVLLKPEQYVQAATAIRTDRFDMMYPYDGKFVDIEGQTLHEAVALLDVGKLNEHSGRIAHPSSVGGAIFFSAECFRNGGQENEYFISWGPEDKERLTRFRKLGFRVGRLPGPLFHMNHPPSQNSLNDLHAAGQENEREFQKVLGMSKEQLVAYIASWPWRKPKKEGNAMSPTPEDQRPAMYHTLHHDQLPKQEVSNHYSAKVILAEVFRHYVPQSILDVGCGIGTWLEVAQQLGVGEIQGIEGTWLDKGLLRVPEQLIANVELERPFDLKRRFDMIVCLEVAEHLSPAAGAAFVESLCRHADLILFSAAIPHQGGTHHVNEQFADYWASLFKRHDYVPVDFLRSLIWSDPAVLIWLRQNIVVYMKKATKPAAAFAELAAHSGPLSIVHPELYLSIARTAQRALEEHRKLLTVLSSGGTFSVKQADGQLTITRSG